MESESATAAERALRSEQGAHRVADRRHRDPTEHRGRGNGRHRHDEQRRHGAPDDCRHVGHSGGSGGRRNRHSEHAYGTAGKGDDRCDAGQTFTGKVTEIGNSPIQTAPAASAVDAGDELQGRRHARQGNRRRCGRGSRAPRKSRPRFATTRSRFRFRRRRSAKSIVDDKGNIVRAAGEREEVTPSEHAGRGAGRRAQAGPDAQGARRRVRGPEQQGGVHAGEDGDRGREVFRGAVGAEGRRRGHYRTVRLGALARGGSGRQAQSTTPAKPKP